MILRFFTLLGVIALVGLTACGDARPLALLSETGPVRVSGSQQADGAQTVRVHFTTDRVIKSDQPGQAVYSIKRASGMSFGPARLDMSSPGRPKVLGTGDLVTFPPTPLPFFERNGRIVTEPEAAAAYAAAGQRMQAELSRALRAGGQRDVLLYVHGFNSQFDDTLQTLVQLWQATDRTALPLAFSWPSGNPGAFGYFKDRESGEFSIFHFKETLRLLSSTPGVRRIHIIAHSRGSDVATSALRELVIEARAGGRDPRATLKIENLIMVAPDLDFSIVRQRLIAERFGPAFGRITIYINPEDGALGLAQMLMAGTRFGRLSADQLDETERRIFARIGNVHFINVSAVTARSSHNYFRKNPEVLADMSVVIRSSALPDSPLRNLDWSEANFWNLTLPAKQGIRDRRDDP